MPYPCRIGAKEDPSHVEKSPSALHRPVTKHCFCFPPYPSFLPCPSCALWLWIAGFVPVKLLAKMRYFLTQTLLLWGAQEWGQDLQGSRSASAAV